MFLIWRYFFIILEGNKKNFRIFFYLDSMNLGFLKLNFLVMNCQNLSNENFLYFYLMAEFRTQRQSICEGFTFKSNPRRKYEAVFHWILFEIFRSFEKKNFPKIFTVILLVMNYSKTKCFSSSLNFSN